jgi:hypothetical protein
MANDADLAVRVSALEVQMATVAADLAEIRANYVTKAYLDERLAAFRAEFIARLDKIEAACATKDDLRELEERLHTWVTDLFVKMFIRMFLTLFFSLAGLQFALFKIYLHQ